MTMALSQSPVLILSQLVLKAVLAEIGLLLQVYEFDPEELASAGLTEDTLTSLHSSLSNLSAMADAASPIVVEQQII